MAVVVVVSEADYNTLSLLQKTALLAKAQFLAKSVGAQWDIEKNVNGPTDSSVGVEGMVIEMRSHLQG